MTEQLFNERELGAVERYDADVYWWDACREEGFDELGCQGCFAGIRDAGAAAFEDFAGKGDERVCVYETGFY